MSDATTIRIFRDESDLAQAAAGLIVETIRLRLESRANFNLFLAGGRTPRNVYARLAQPEIASQPFWQRVQFFWGDERCVAADHVDSNYRMAFEALLKGLALPARNLHRVPGEMGCRAAADAYEERLRGVFSGSLQTGHTGPDLVLLGLGEDGHTASLFPGDASLTAGDRWAVSVEHRKPPSPLVDRVSLTLQAINQAAQIVFIVSGESKASIVRRIFDDRGAESRLPAQMVRPTGGMVTWLMDQPAASLLNN